jgi:hypothetical protein
MLAHIYFRLQQKSDSALLSWRVRPSYPPLFWIVPPRASGNLAVAKRPACAHRLGAVRPPGLLSMPVIVLIDSPGNSNPRRLLRDTGKIKILVADISQLRSMSSRFHIQPFSNPFYNSPAPHSNALLTTIDRFDAIGRVPVNRSRKVSKTLVSANLLAWTLFCCLIFIYCAFPSRFAFIHYRYSADQSIDYCLKKLYHLCEPWLIFSMHDTTTCQTNDETRPEAIVVLRHCSEGVSNYPKLAKILNLNSHEPHVITCA